MNVLIRTPKRDDYIEGIGIRLSVEESSKLPSRPGVMVIWEDGTSYNLMDPNSVQFCGKFVTDITEQETFLWRLKHGV